MEKGNDFSWFFLMVFMVLSTFMVLNLFIGVVVTALDEVTGDGKPKPVPVDGDAVMAELKALREEVARLSEARR